MRYRIIFFHIILGSISIFASAPKSPTHRAPKAEDDNEIRRELGLKARSSIDHQGSPKIAFDKQIQSIRAMQERDRARLEQIAASDSYNKHAARAIDKAQATNNARVEQLNERITHLNDGAADLSRRGKEIKKSISQTRRIIWGIGIIATGLGLFLWHTSRKNTKKS